jgi:hypothetical protein
MLAERYRPSEKLQAPAGVASKARGAAAPDCCDGAAERLWRGREAETNNEASRSITVRINAAAILMCFVPLASSLSKESAVI